MATEKTNNVRAMNSLRRSFSRLSLIINCNFYGDKSEAFITLSYDYKVTEDKEISRDIDSLWNGFQRKNKEKIPYRCLIIVEYNKYGNPHYHILLKRLDGQNISLEELSQKFLWNKGSRDIRPLYTTDGLSEYLTPFNVRRKRKQIRYYKPGMQIYRRRGEFVNPKKIKTSYSDALNLARMCSMTEYKRQSFDIVNAITNNVVNKINKIYMKTEDYQ